MTDCMMPTDALRWWSLNDPDKRAIVYRGDPVTYRELSAWVDRVAWRLAEAGVRIGDRVGVIGENSIPWCVAGLATMKLGAVHAALNHRMVADELQGLINKTGTQLVVADEDFLERMQVVAVNVPALDLMPLAEIAALREGEDKPYVSPEVDADDVAMIVYSSGSTGMPKGIMYTNKTIFAYVTEWMLMELAMGREARILLPQPLAGMGGFGNAVLRCIIIGGTLFLEPKLDPPWALRLLTEERCNSLMAVPVIFQRIAALPEFETADLSSLELAIIGGALVPLDQFDKWHARGASLRQVYGLTEAGGAFTVMSVEGAREHPDRCGRGGMLRQIKIVRPDASQCAPNEEGEIIVRGPSVMKGYWNDEAATVAVLKDGWLHTGDLGQVDEDGLLKITDRLKEVIISGGYNIGPAQIENVLLDLDDVEECAVVGVHDEKFGETPAAFVRLSGQLPVETIIAHCNERLSDYKVPRYVVFVDEPFPRSHEGKIAKVQLRKQYARELAAAPKVR
jgi:fatty-acyl-CoA synthase